MANKQENSMSKLMSSFASEDGVWTEQAVLDLAVQLVERCAEIADDCVQKRLDYPGDRMRAQFGLFGSVD